MKTFAFDYPWAERDEWFLPDGEEMMQGQFPILDEQIDFVLNAMAKTQFDKKEVGVSGQRTCVQAGGAFGLYPRRLSDHFEKVYTFEPLIANLQCMAANLGLRQNIVVATNALWHEHAKLHMKYSKKVKNSYGAHHVSTLGKGEISDAYPLDDWNLEEVDLIWLDIEGAEVWALMGAFKTIRKNQPVIVIEQHKNLPQHKELEVRLDSASYLLKRTHKYREYGRTHGDLVFVPA